MSTFRKIMCKIGRHRKLDVIQTFGSAQHVGCPDCGREFAIHHGLRVFLPWSSDFASLYQTMGFDTDSATRRWRQYVEGRGHA